MLALTGPCLFATALFSPLFIEVEQAKRGGFVAEPADSAVREVLSYLGDDVNVRRHDRM